MHFYFYFLLITSFLATGCFSSGPKPVTREDDKIRSALMADLKQLESDGSIMENQIDLARKRIHDLAISTKMVDISKKDLYQKERFIGQIGQQIAYLKLQLNNREKNFLENQAKMTKESLDAEYSQYMIDKAANPQKYPWRVSSNGRKSAEPKPKAPASDSGHH